MDWNSLEYWKSSNGKAQRRDSMKVVVIILVGGIFLLDSISVLSTQCERSSWVKTYAPETCAVLGFPPVSQEELD